MINIAVLGYGTVGSGVVEVINTNHESINKRAGDEINIKYVLDLRDFPGDPVEKVLVHDYEVIVNDPEVDIVVEVMGGIEPAYTFVKRALQAGKSVSTSNKALVAKHGSELMEIAKEKNINFLFEASCGGGIPIIRALNSSLTADEIDEITGILNGTTNYILTQMTENGESFGTALKAAQEKGSAEADPTADVSGLDALRKIMLGCAVAYDILPEDGLLNEGIENLRAADAADIKRRGLTCRLLAKCGKNADGSIYAYVQPVLLGADAPECAVKKNFNMAKYTGRNSGLIVLMGQGAGRYPTASAVIRDIECLRAGQREMLTAACRAGAADNAQSVCRYYVRLPEIYAHELPAESASVEDGAARVITKEMSVRDMHAFAKRIRKAGAAVFFAEMA